MKARFAFAVVLTLAVPAPAVGWPSASLAQGQDGRAFSPSEVRELRRQLGAALTERDVARASAATTRRIATAAHAEIVRVAEIFGLPVGTPANVVAEQLERWAEEDRNNREELARLRDIAGGTRLGETGDAAAQAISLAQAAFDDGRLDDAGDALAQLESLRRVADTGAGDLWVHSVVARSGLARQQRKFDVAENFLVEAERFEERQSRRIQFVFRINRAGNAYAQGLAQADNAALERAIELYTESAGFVDRGSDAEDWTSAEVGLGAALFMLGSREAGTARLEQAVSVYEAVLEEWPRDRNSLQWALAKADVGLALAALGERESGEAAKAKLNQAVTAYRAAIENLPRSQAPLSWARVQNNLGVALKALARRESGTERINEAVEAFHAALEERTPESDPLQWAGTQIGLAGALTILGQKERSTARLREAADAYRPALNDTTRVQMPLWWAAGQRGLGDTLFLWGSMENSTPLLQEAVGHYRAALEENTRTAAPLEWASTQINLAKSLVMIAEGHGRVDGLSRIRADLVYAIQIFERSNQHNSATQVRQLIGQIDSLSGR